jgi:hypothetical protein
MLFSMRGALDEVVKIKEAKSGRQREEAKEDSQKRGLDELI